MRRAHAIEKRAVRWKRSCGLSLSMNRVIGSMKEVCQRNEIARETGYVWILPPRTTQDGPRESALNLTNRETRRPSCEADERFQLLQDGQSATLILTKIITVRVIYIPFDQPFSMHVRHTNRQLNSLCREVPPTPARSRCLA